MGRIVISVFLWVLVGGYASAQDVENLPIENHPVFTNQMDEYLWHQVDARMDIKELKANTRYNKRLLRRTIKHYLESTFESLGVSKNTIKLTGAAIVLATGEDLKFSLNDKKTMFVEIKDLNDKERAIEYKFNFSW